MSDKKIPLCIYHSGCYDGFCAAWLFAYGLDCDLFPASYGDDPPLAESAGRDVYVVDFSYPVEDTKRLHAGSSRLTILDHHKTAEKHLSSLQDDPSLHVEFDMSRSGARMAWDYIACRSGRLGSLKDSEHPFDKAPWLVKYVEDRDLWRFKLPDSRSVNAYIQSCDLTLDSFDDLFDLGPDFACSKGDAIMKYQQKCCRSMVEHKKLFSIKGNHVHAVNCPVSTLISDTAGLIAEEHGVGATWTCNGDGTQLWSLRSRGDQDVSVIAESMGGGGHKAAAGFKCKYGDVSPA